MTTPLVASYIAGSQRLCGVPRRHDTSRASLIALSVHETTTIPVAIA